MFRDPLKTEVTIVSVDDPAPRPTSSRDTGSLSLPVTCAAVADAPAHAVLQALWPRIGSEPLPPVQD